MPLSTYVLLVDPGNDNNDMGFGLPVKTRVKVVEKLCKTIPIVNLSAVCLGIFAGYTVPRGIDIKQYCLLMRPRLRLRNVLRWAQNGSKHQGRNDHIILGHH